MAETPDGTVTAEPEVGSYFVANYPPFSVWNREAVDRDARPALDAPPGRRRPARSVPAHSVLPEALPLLLLPRLHEQERAGSRSVPGSARARVGRCTAGSRALAGRPVDFVYFGGGTPSFLSTRQLESLVDRLTAVSPWTSAQEVTFECEPGTLTEPKLAAIRGWASRG